MRSFILLCTIGILSSTISAQDFEVVSSFPADGAFGVTTDSVLITFSEPLSIDFENDDLEESGFFGALEPEDSFVPDSMALSEDGLTFKFFGTFDDDTDFLLYLMGAESVSGKQLATPFVMQFTTADTRGEFVITGFIDADDVNALEDLEMDGFTAILTLTPPEFMFYDSGDDEEEENNGGAYAPTQSSFRLIKGTEHNGENGHEGEDDIIPVYATLVDAETGEYEINGVRAGTYFPLAYNLFEIFEFEGSEVGYEMMDFMPSAFRYDANGDLGIDSVIVNSTTAPDDTVRNIDLTYLDLEPFTIEDAFDIAELYFSVNSVSGFELRGGASRYFYDKYDDYIFKTINENGGDDEVIITGFNMAWEVFAYSATKDSVAFMVVTPVGVEQFDILGEGDIDEPVDLSEIKPLPTTFIDSDEAAEIMLQEGVESFINSLEYEFGDLDFGWDFELQLLHEYWNYTPDPTVTAPVFWKGTLYGFGNDHNNGSYLDAEYSIFLDPATGAVLLEEATEIPDIETISLVDFLLPNGTPDPTGDSLVFVFDGELDLDLAAMDPEDMGILFFIEPEDSAEITGINYEAGDGGSQVTVYVDLTDDTDFIVFLAEANGTNGQQLDQPYVLQFTTGSTANRFTISGYLETPDIDINNYFKNVVVMLVEEEPLFGFDDFGDDEEEDHNNGTNAPVDNHEEEEDDEDFVPIYAANVDAESGYFEINLIREGTYFPIAFDVMEMEDDGENGFEEEFFFPKIFYYDADEDRFPDTLAINSTTAPSDTLSDLELMALSIDRFTLTEAIDLAQARIDNLQIGVVEFMGGATFYDFFGFMIFEPTMGLASPKAVVNDHHGGDEFMNPFMMELDGKNFLWEVFAYHPAKDSVLIGFVTPIGAIFEGFLGEGDIEEPIEFDLIDPLPAQIIDSDSAAFLFDLNGGEAFFDFLEQTYPPGSYSWSHEIQAFHEYWGYPFNATPEAPVAWKATYESFYFDMNMGQAFSDSLVIYLDVQTGAVLFSELTVNNELERDAPTEIKLGQNYPNPFNPSTNIPFELSSASNVTIDIYNLLGQKVATLTDELYNAGRHTVAWNASNYSSGIYFYRLTAGDIIQTKKLMLIK